MAKIVVSLILLVRRMWVVGGGMATNHQDKMITNNISYLITTNNFCVVLMSLSRNASKKVKTRPVLEVSLCLIDGVVEDRWCLAM